MRFARVALVAGGVVAPLMFVACTALAAAGQPGYSHVVDHLSGLAAVPAERRRWMVAGFVVLGVGVALVGSAIARIERKRLAPAAFVVAGVAIVLVGLLPRDCVAVACTQPSWHHRAHDVASAPAYLLAVALPLLLSTTAVRLPASRRVAALVVAGAGVLLAVFAATPVDRAGGLVQRLALAFPLGWLVAVSVGWARHTGEASAIRPPSARPSPHPIGPGRWRTARRS